MVKSFYTLVPGFILTLMIYLSTFAQRLTVLCHHKADGKQYSTYKDIIKSHLSCRKVERRSESTGLDLRHSHTAYFLFDK